MSSIIGGYNYDIFVSYRQKDNKGDRWVSEFVEALKTELESTFKEEISVYFDINPHDGLLETYDVDASLKEKLKCLIFIPIISRTYCDPKSFAWEHEFKAFVEQASKDKFGLKVNLSNGNVASRILPVRIHDLDSVDIKLCVSVLGGVLRGVEFIYKEPGVNRPLSANEDNPKDNLNHSIYRNQVNKVANSIKEIVEGLRTESSQRVNGKDKSEELFNKAKEDRKIGLKPRNKAIKSKLVSTVAVLVVLIMASIFTYSKIFKRDTLEKLRSSGEGIVVAVLPFQNKTNDTTNNILQGWIQDNLINLLSNSEELKVKQTESVSAVIISQDVREYASISPSLAGLISRKLDTDIFIYGSIKKDVAFIRLTAQLIDSKTEEIFKNFQIDVPFNKEITNKIIDSLSVMVRDFLEVTKLKKESPDNLQGMLSSINSPEAYRYFIAGKKAFEKKDYSTVFENLTKAIEIDTNFTYAPILLAQAYRNVGRFDEAKELVLKQHEKRERMSYQMKTYTDWIYSVNYETPNEWIKYLEQLLEIDNQSPDYHYLLGWAYLELNKYDKAIPEYQKALEINQRWDSKPWWVGNYTNLGYIYHKTGQYTKEEELYKKAERDFPDDPTLIYQQAILALTQKNANAANILIEKYKSINSENSSSEADIIASIGWMYFEAGYLDKSEQYLRQSLSFEPYNPDRLNSLAWLLIDKDRNINEGMELVDKILVQSRDNYEYLETKGWGLYKLGKYKEALDILQKSWDLRREKAVYDHEAYLHLEAAKKAAVRQKNN